MVHDPLMSRSSGIPFVFPGLENVRCLFTTALQGSLALPSGQDNTDAGQAVIENRRCLLKSLGIAAWAELQQVHSDALAFDPEPTAVTDTVYPEADGACTQRPGLALAIKTADCQPLLLAARDGSAIAALHAGWRGNAMNFPASGLARFCSAYGLTPENVLAVRGPSLGPGAAEFINFDLEWPPSFRLWFDAQRKTMDLWRLTRDQLVAAGMLPGNIFSLDLCTRSLPGLFFSHRRKENGRQMSLIWII